MKLLKYIKGFRKGKDAHRIELDAMSDPFLNEALEGYNLVKGDHAKRIIEMQKMISKKTEPKNHWYLLSAVSAAAIVLIVSYFTVFEKSISGNLDSEMLAQAYSDNDEVLYIYVPDAYADKIEMEENLDIDFSKPVQNLEIYVSEEYVERKRAKISMGNKPEKTTPAIISNLEELLAPEEPINIYAPEEYLKKKNING